MKMMLSKTQQETLKRVLDERDASDMALTIGEVELRERLERESVVFLSVEDQAIALRAVGDALGGRIPEVELYSILERGIPLEKDPVWQAVMNAPMSKEAMSPEANAAIEAYERAKHEKRLTCAIEVLREEAASASDALGMGIPIEVHVKANERAKALYAAVDALLETASQELRARLTPTIGEERRAAAKRMLAEAKARR